MIDPTELLRLLRSGCAVTPHQIQAAEWIERLKAPLSNESSLRCEETQRLRAALQEIVDQWDDHGGAVKMKGIASRALEGGGENE